MTIIRPCQFTDGDMTGGTDHPEYNSTYPLLTSLCGRANKCRRSSRHEDMEGTEAPSGRAWPDHGSVIPSVARPVAFITVTSARVLPLLLGAVTGRVAVLILLLVRVPTTVRVTGAVSGIAVIAIGLRSVLHLLAGVFGHTSDPAASHEPVTFFGAIDYPVADFVAFALGLAAQH